MAAELFHIPYRVPKWSSCRNVVVPRLGTPHSQAEVTWGPVGQRLATNPHGSTHRGLQKQAEDGNPQSAVGFHLEPHTSHAELR